MPNYNAWRSAAMITLGYQPSLPQKHPYAVGRPCGHSTSEEVGVLCPDWTAKRQCRSQNRPVVRIALPEPFPGLSFELAINVASNQFHQVSQGAQEGERLFGIAAAFDGEPGQMFFG